MELVTLVLVCTSYVASLVVINSLGLERFDITRVSCVSVNAKF